MSLLKFGAPQSVECGGSDTTEADLKAKLKEDERKAKERGELPLHEISATSCLGLGLLIEDSQYIFLLSLWNILVISFKAAPFRKIMGDGEMTWSQLTDIKQRCSTLRRQIEQYQELQMVYMPRVML